MYSGMYGAGCIINPASGLCKWDPAQPQSKFCNRTTSATGRQTCVKVKGLIEGESAPKRALSAKQLEVLQRGRATQQVKATESAMSRMFQTGDITATRALKPCPPGKIRNVVTNRCIDAVLRGATPGQIEEGQMFRPWAPPTERVMKPRVKRAQQTQRIQSAQQGQRIQ